MASTNSLPGAVRETSTEALTAIFVSLDKLVSNKKLAGEPTLPHLNAIHKDIAGELKRREVSEAGIVTSPFSTHVIGQMLAYWMARQKEIKVGNSYYYYSKPENRSRLSIAKRAKFSTELRVKGNGAASRSDHLDQALTRLNQHLEERLKIEEITFPLQDVDETIYQLAQRIQRVIVFAEATGTDAAFEWEVQYYRRISFVFDREYGSVSDEGSSPSLLLAMLTKAVAQFEEKAKLKQEG